MIKGIIFDFDGTLADTTNLILTTFKHSCREVLGFELERSAITATFGLPLPKAFEVLTGRPDLDEILRNYYREFNNEHHEELISPIVGAKELLQELKVRGLKVGIVTSKKPPMLERGLKALGLTEYIDAYVAFGDTVHAKPHGEPSQVALTKLGLAPEECLCVGDSPFDLQSGRAAGMKTVAVRYTETDWEKLLLEGKPDYVIDNPAGLLKLI